MAKFLVIHPNIDIYGGGERVAHHILKALATHGQDVELLTFEFDKKQYEQILGDKFPQIKVHDLGKRIEAEPPFSVYKRRRKIIKELRKFKQNNTYDYTFSTQTFSAFEAELLDKAKKNLAYVHFPEIHHDYAHSKLSKRIYLWLYKKWLERGIGKLDMVFCNSNYTKEMTQKYWGKFGISEPIVAYPPVEDRFWSTKPIEERAKRLIYIGRFVPRKRHELMKQLALSFPDWEFMSIGALRDTEEAWFAEFSKNIPANYVLKPNLLGDDLIKLLHDSRIYCHLMEGEHFGIAPMEAIASGCITLVHNSGGSRELIPEEFRWTTFEDLKEKISQLTSSPNEPVLWKNKKQELREKISILKPQHFQDQIWSHTQSLLRTQKNDVP
jgi:glycosyltransferase involved in cell wall biosynthesis